MKFKIHYTGATYLGPTIQRLDLLAISIKVIGAQSQINTDGKCIDMHIVLGTRPKLR